MSEKVLYRTTLTPKHQPTQKTVHTNDGKLLPPPHGLAIVQLPDDPGVYLYYLDEDGDEQTDTYHATVEQAMNQARFEFSVNVDEWICL